MFINFPILCKRNRKFLKFILLPITTLYINKLFQDASFNNGSTKLITTNQSHQAEKDVLQYADHYYCKNNTTLQLLTIWILPLATKIITVPNDISHALCLLVTVKSKLFLPYSLQMMLCCCQKRKQLWLRGEGGGGRGGSVQIVLFPKWKSFTVV